ncbi:MAG TPA: serine hydrolase [Draconibacterium sp.]|nr:serine hydrolase [Draconibacterium sp.]
MNIQLKHIAIVLATVGVFSSCRTLIYNTPDLSDHKIFPYRVIKNAPESIYYFANSDTSHQLGKEIYTSYSSLLPNDVTLDDYVEGSKTAALIVIRNDSIIYEKYNKNYQESSIFNTFSVTKAFITTLVGIAIGEGMIKNVDQSITDYIPELLEKEGFSEITIRHLLDHTSGIKFSDARYNPFSDNARYYYTRNLRKLVLKAELYVSPGVETHYSSVNVQLLALILERATGATLSSYLQEKIWQRIGMQYEATWSLDNKRENSFEKGFSCLNCTAIDLAKLGRLYLNNGVSDNKQILPQSFIYDATKRGTTDGSCLDFHYNFRLGPKQYGSYYARGLYGQLIYIYPKENIIIVRVGEKDLKYNPQFIDHVVLEIIDQI